MSSTIDPDKTQQHHREFNFSVVETQQYDTEERIVSLTYHIDYQPVPHLILRLTTREMATVDNQRIKRLLYMNARELCDQTQDELAAANEATKHLDEAHVVTCRGMNEQQVSFLTQFMLAYNQQGMLATSLEQTGSSPC